MMLAMFAMRKVLFRACDLMSGLQYTQFRQGHLIRRQEHESYIELLHLCDSHMPQKADQPVSGRCQWM